MKWKILKQLNHDAVFCRDVEEKSMQIFMRVGRFFTPPLITALLLSLCENRTDGRVEEVHSRLLYRGTGGKH